MSLSLVTVANLGLGNLASVERAFRILGAEVEITTDANRVAQADKLVVPGQGAFRDCALALEAGFAEAIETFIQRGNPYFGICLGMQLLFETSEEAPGKTGLGIFPGKVVRFPKQHADPDTHQILKVPHMGWNQISTRHPYLTHSEWYYFVHSYYCLPQDEHRTVATSDYGFEFCAAVAKDNIFACQFHPEKSAEAGLAVIKNFLSAN